MQQQLQQDILNIKYISPSNSLARVYVAELEDKSCIEFVESIQPPLDINEKWVLIVSTLKGCPVKCSICDAGLTYKGKLNQEQIFEQINYMVRSRYPNLKVPAKKFKIQFARMGDPAFNTAVLDVIKLLPKRYPETNIIPCISTIAPKGCDVFFDSLLKIKNSLFSNGNFQMQFSLHTSNEQARKKIITVDTWTFKQMAEYGKIFYKNGDKKITLNFATPLNYPLEPEHIKNIFDPEFFIIKLTPVNPTKQALNAGLQSLINPNQPIKNKQIVNSFNKLGYQVILSIGELEENKIGSNCGMFVSSLK